ncbi:MAG: type II toxin-antitoxin system prevent-host-death family antitoxin [Phormidesmis sp.]
MEIAAGQFKAQCLKLMDRVQQTKEEVVITKYGKPVARLVPIELASEDSIVGWMKGSVTITGDIVAPLDEYWEADHL